ncbi:MAG: cation transporter [Clostridia bacterium]|nr:cation transporter [Clostridia bacterium]
MEKDNSKRVALRVSAVSIGLNIFLTVFKLAAGIAGHSGAMVSDAIHSASDVFSTVIVIIGFVVSRRKSDFEHQYGHERMECVSAMLLAVILAATGAGIGYNGMLKIFSQDYGTLQQPEFIALLAAIISILTKEAMYWYTVFAARKINSGSLKADAWHHRSDALSSVGSLIGIAGAMCGVKVLDPAASVVISVFIIKAAYDITKDAIDKMIDKSCDKETVAKMSTIVTEQEGVKRLDLIRTRLFGNKIYVDIEISADENLSLRESHEISKNVHDAIETEFPLVKHCMVHVNPFFDDKNEP